MAPPVRFTDLDECVEATLKRVGNRIVLGLPVAIGKPNELVNVFVRRALADPRIQLTIVTALSLRAPRWRSDLERRFVEPLAHRIFGDYTELEYVRLIEEKRCRRTSKCSSSTWSRARGSMTSTSSSNT